ncbi:serine/threonine protein kinase (plasmid) [Brasilonema octagenarum UFV-E1]|nr:serine/threonine protein kinase [Brasilonema octagenarum UFV-E1]
MNSSDSSWIGRLIGDNKRYRLEKRLGGGGMGDVYQAIDMRVGQQVALKLLKGTFVASEEMRKRFEREIAVCAALPNEHIVKIIDAGVTGDIPFYVMEYLRGKTLRELLLKEKRLTVERTVAIMIQVCLGLQLAHEGVTLWQDGAKTSEHIRVVHRDLKPDNIFIIPTELGEWVKILDFGIAKIRNESSEQTNLTSTFLGTFRYAAPEQLKGDRDLDGRADIYSLGIILYEMLSAADPFGFSIKSRSISEASWIFAHTSQPPKSLRSQPGCEQLSPELEAVVIRCLQKNPDERFATVKELNRALQAVTNSTTKGHHIEIIPQPRQQEGSNDETVPRPLEMKGSDKETVPRPLEMKGSDKETVPRPLEAEDFDSETAARSSQTEQSNNQTIARLLKPNGEGDEGQTPAQQPSGGQNREETLFQQQPPQPPTGQNREETLFQQQSPQPPTGQNREETLFQQQSPQPPTGRNREPTLFQPQPPSNPDSRNAVKETNIQQNAGHREARKLPMNLAIVLGIGIGLVVVGGIAYAFSQSRRVIDKTPSLQRQGNYQECISIAELVPADFNLDTEAQKYLNSCRIEYARKLANENKLKEAIEEARKIPQTSPRYQEAQKNIA